MSKAEGRPTWQWQIENIACDLSLIVTLLGHILEHVSKWPEHFYYWPFWEAFGCHQLQAEDPASLQEYQELFFYSLLQLCTGKRWQTERQLIYMYVNQFIIHIDTTL